MCVSIVQYVDVEEDHFTSSTNDDDVDGYEFSVSNKNDVMSIKLAFPKEKDQPEQWPEIAGGIFVVIAIGFFGVTAFKNYQKRKDYQEVPVSLTV